MNSDTILIASATMIVGVLFVTTIAQVITGRRKTVAGWVYTFTLLSILPFSMSAIFALYEYTDNAKFCCALGFAFFVVLLLSASWEAYSHLERKI